MNQCDLCQAKYKTYQVSDGVLMLSKQGLESVPSSGVSWPQPSGWRYRLQLTLYGRAYARFLWRNREGLSTVSPVVIGVLTKTWLNRVQIFLELLTRRSEHYLTRYRRERL